MPLCFVFAAEQEILNNTSKFFLEKHVKAKNGVKKKKTVFVLLSHVEVPN